MSFRDSGHQKNWQLFLFCLVAITLIAFFANVPFVEAQSSARLRLIQSDTSRIILELEVSGYDSRDVPIGGATYSLFSIGDLGRTDEAGKPQLPVKGTMIGIPPGAQPTLRIVDDQAQTANVPRHPLPAPTITAQRDPRQTLPGPASQSFTPNAATYLANQFYPNAASKIGDTGDWRSQHYATIQFYPLQYNPVTRQLVLHRRLRVEITLGYPRGQSPATLGGASNEGAFESVFESAFINYSAAKNWRAPRSAAPVLRRAAAPTLAGDWYRIGVNADGIYKVTCGQLAAAKGSTLNITPSTLRLVKQVFTTPVESAINVVGGGWGTCNSSDTSDYIEFYGLASTSKYTTTNTYWLTYGGSAGIRMPERDGSIGGGSAATAFTKTNHLEQNLLYRPTTPRTEGYEHWYWEYLYPIGGATARDYAFQISNFVSNSLSATLMTTLVGYDAGDHHTRMWLNNCGTINDFTWSGRVVTTAILSISNSCVNPITNTVHITESNENPYTYTFVLTNYFDFSYQSGFTATNDLIQFRQPVSNTWQYNIDGYSIPSFKIFDITDPLSVTRILTSTFSGSGPYQLQFTDPVTTTPREYLALTTSKLLSTTNVALVSESDLYSASNGADYIIIAATPFITNSQLLTLVATRSAQFSRPVKLIDVQNIYDQFGDGLADPQAIRDFLQYAYSNWTSPAPQFVLLVGAGTFDPKGYCLPPAVCSQVQTPPNSTLIAPYLRMVDPDLIGFGETDSDNCLVSFAAPCTLITHTLPYMSIGRLPADTSADVTALVSKILNYENPVGGTWRSTASFVADNAYNQNLAPPPDWIPDSGGDFWSFSDEIVSNTLYFPSGLRGDRIYYNPCPASFNPPTYPCALPYSSYMTSTNAHDAILAAINSGRVIINYIGHGDIRNWAFENLFSAPPLSSDLESLTNGNKTPVMLELTCRTGYFIYPHPNNQSLAKLNVNLPNNGAVASWAAVGVGFVTSHDLLEKGFFNAVMNQNNRRLGPATDAGKLNLLATGYNLDLLDTIILFGDPASRLAVQFSYDLPFIRK